MYSDEQHRQALEMYFEEGLSNAEVVKRLGWPSTYTLFKWIHHDKRYKSQLKRFSTAEKIQACQMLKKTKSLSRTARRYGCSRKTLYHWKTRYDKQGVSGLDLRGRYMHMKPKIKPKDTKKIDDIDELRDLVDELRLDNDIMRETIKVLKAESPSLNRMSNKEKTRVADKLRKNHRLNKILDKLCLSRSTYYYEHARLLAKDKYADLKVRIYCLFFSNNQIWGYRTITQRLRQDKKDPVYVSEKVVRRLMRQMGLVAVYVKKPRRHYSSYKGEISQAPPNLVRRDFHADAPNKLWLTDITEFHLTGYKVYLSALLDCYDGYVVSWTIGNSPTQKLANTMLRQAIDTLKPGEHPIIHSDRGSHYRRASWIDLCMKAHLVRSMSKKGCSPDNSACEGFFGRLKNEFFYYRDWGTISFKQFTRRLSSYIAAYNNYRIKKNLGWQSPVQYRLSQAIIS